MCSRLPGTRPAPDCVVDVRDTPRGGQLGLGAHWRPRSAGSEFSGMSTPQVKPPGRERARSAAPSPPRTARPGSLKCTWASIRPGRMCEPVARRRSRARHLRAPRAGSSAAITPSASGDLRSVSVRMIASKLTQGSCDSWPACTRVLRHDRLHLRARVGGPARALAARRGRHRLDRRFVLLHPARQPPRGARARRGCRSRRDGRVVGGPRRRLLPRSEVSGRPACAARAGWPGSSGRPTRPGSRASRCCCIVYFSNARAYLIDRSVADLTVAAGDRDLAPACCSPRWLVYDVLCRMLGRVSRGCWRWRCSGSSRSRPTSPAACSPRARCSSRSAR